MYPYEFLIVTITCAWPLLGLLTVYGFRLSTQVQMFFLLIYGGTLKTASEASPQRVRWSVPRRPRAGIFVPFAFLLLFPLFPLFCILSFLLPASKAQFTESHKMSVLTKNTGILFALLQRRLFRRWTEYRDSSHVSLHILRHILVWPTQRGGIFAWRFQASPQTPDTWRKQTKDESDNLIKKKRKIRITQYLRWPLRVSDPRALMSAALWRCGSQEVVRSNLSNERTFQARHCGLWLQPSAHAVLTTKKQAKLFTDSSLTSPAKMSPILSSYCHHSRLSLSHLPSSFSLLFFFEALLLSLLKCGWSCYFNPESTYSSTKEGMRHINRKCKGTNPTWAALRRTDSHIRALTGVLLCLACSASVSVYTACDSSGYQEGGNSICKKGGQF